MLSAQEHRSPFTCPATPRPEITVSAVQYYTDSHGSLIDPKLAEANSILTISLRRYLLELGQMTDEAIKRLPIRDANLDCAIKWLFEWAEADALRTVGENGSVLRTMSVTSLALSYFKILAAIETCDLRVKTIGAWLRKIVADVVLQETRGRPPGQENNVTFWASLAAYTIGVAVADPHLRQWALGVYRRALDAVGPSGFWASETKRRTKALEYQLFALTPIVLFRIISEHQIEPRIDQQDDKLHRIVRASLDALHNPSAIEAEAGVPIETRGLEQLATTITLMKAYICRFPDRLEGSRIPNRNRRDWRIGTDLAFMQCPKGGPFPFALTQCGRQ